MKLDIESLAREAGMEVHPRKGQIRIGSAIFTGCDSTEQVKAFARLIVERCAVIVDTNADGCQRGSDMRLVLQSNAAAIRQLLEDK